MSPRLNQDIRIKSAYDIYDKYHSGKFIIHKTTRAGCTTAMVSESINRVHLGENERTLILVPTNAIAQKTVIDTAIKYSDVENPRVIQILSNRHCIKNQELFNQYPDLEKLSIIPLPEKCDECEYYMTCPVTKIAREPIPDILVMTYDKLVAVMMSSGNGILKQCIIGAIESMDNVIADEIHELQYSRMVTISAYNTGRSKPYFDIDYYLPILQRYEEFPNISKLLIKFIELMSCDSTNEIIRLLYDGAVSDDYTKKFLAFNVNNEHILITDLDSDSFLEFLVGIYAEIVDIVKNNSYMQIPMYFIQQLYNIVNLELSPMLIFNSFRDGADVNINLNSLDTPWSRMLKKFFEIFDFNRVFMTSATICSYDYRVFFEEDEDIKNIKFGDGGDPLHTNDKMLVLADENPNHIIGRGSDFNRILPFILDVINEYGENNVMVLTLNMRLAGAISKELKKRGFKNALATYYKSPLTMGVASDRRVIVSIGSAQKPINTYDASANTKQDSLILREEAVHCDTYQAWSRAKDSNANEPSIIFALGSDTIECNNILTWGYNRSVDLQEKEISVDEMLNKPKLISCNDYDEMIMRATNFMNGDDYDFEYNNKIQQNKKKIKKITRTIKTSYEFLKFMMNRRNEQLFLQQDGGGYDQTIRFNISPNIAMKHIKGTHTFATYERSEENTCKWVCFDIDVHRDSNDTEAEYRTKIDNAMVYLTRLTGFLRRNEIPYILEHSGSDYSYHIWVFLYETGFLQAQRFGQYIVKLLGIDVEIYPKVKSRDSMGAGIKLPFATHRKHGGKSSIYKNGLWYRSVEDMGGIEITSVDISGIQFYEPKPTLIDKKTGKKSVIKDTDIGVRPCILNALNEDLRGSDGHNMRIAIVREFYNNGMTDANDLAMLFKNQSDFDYNETLRYISGIIHKDTKTWRKETLEFKCASFIYCSDCEHELCKVRG